MALIAYQWPETIQPASCEFGRSRPQARLLSPTTRTQSIIRRGMPLWMASIAWSVKPVDTSLVRFILDGLEGRRGSVMLRDYSVTSVASKGTVIVASTAAANSTSVFTSGWTPSMTVLVAGAYLQIGKRLYLASTDVVSSGFGEATIPLDRPLRATASYGAPINYQTPCCEFRMASDDWSGIGSADSALLSIRADFIETAEDVT